MTRSGASSGSPAGTTSTSPSRSQGRTSAGRTSQNSARFPLPEALGHTARSCPPAASRNATRSVPVTPRPASIARASAVPTSPEVADEATAVSSTRRLVR
ncbi:hypothetical protein [Amycolatopsis sp. cmx-4-83]|uniref:hypothetical protein n=1 Tax=Amycolatopsis sp. cmx-4-83 TaxID=2790940 RepID=UPI0039796587